jgi:hypothetical protein
VLEALVSFHFFYITNLLSILYSHTHSFSITSLTLNHRNDFFKHRHYHITHLTTCLLLWPSFHHLPKVLMASHGVINLSNDTCSCHSMSQLPMLRATTITAPPLPSKPTSHMLQIMAHTARLTFSFPAHLQPLISHSEPPIPTVTSPPTTAVTGAPTMSKMATKANSSA